MRSLRKSAALYERLSRDDDLAGESNSILNQKKYLEDYAKANNIKNYTHFTDDGYSGVNFNRPGFQKMIAEVEAGNIDTIIVKDMSRFGRNYLQVGFYTEVLFPQKEVRFIAINNNIDSSNSNDNDFAPFLNIMNEWYAKDTSNKIRAIFDARMKDGKRCSGSITFGYLKSNKDKEMLEIDPLAADIVKRIFNLANEGKSVREIAETLRADKVLAPAAYAEKYQIEGYSRFKYTDPYLWSYSTIRKILDREEYLGHTILHKSVCVNFKLHKRKDVPKEEQYIFPNTHEAIISQELWDNVHRRLKRANRATAWGSHKHRLCGYLFCADCERQMALQCHYKKNSKEPVFSFRCSGYGNRISSCKSHSISVKIIEDVLLSSIQRICKFAEIDEQSFAQELQKTWNEKQKKIPEQNKVNLNKLNKRYEEISGLIKGLYENLISGILPERQYKLLSRQYDEEQSELEIKIKETEEALKIENERNIDITKFLTVIRKYKNPTEITDIMLNELVDKIYIHEAKGKGNSKTQQIDIYFNFIGEVNIAYTEEELRQERENELQLMRDRKEREKQRSAKYRAERKAKRIAANGGQPLNYRICPQCGKEFLAASNRQKFCSKTCADAFRLNEKRKAKRAERGNHYYNEKHCELCGKPYYPNSSIQKYCSDECRRKIHSTQAHEFYLKNKTQIAAVNS